jgi:CRISP-associated protein Cas1
MEQIASGDLKSILLSKRANIYYLEHCRVLQNGGRVEYVTVQGNRSNYWNIPIANTTTILLGSGTSITQAAMRELAKAGVIVGFCGGNGMPLYAGSDVEVDFEWIVPQSEYRPTEYLQRWIIAFTNEEKRLALAKHLQRARINNIRKVWPKKIFSEVDHNFSNHYLNETLNRFEEQIEKSKTTTDLLAHEGELTKELYKKSAQAVEYGKFSRIKRGEGKDFANKFLDQGNYLAYGLAASAAWVLGLPFGLAVLHGKTRRGGLIFDIADIIKDAMILPNAFLAAKEGDDSRSFGIRIKNFLLENEALDIMIDTVKNSIDANNR